MLCRIPLYPSVLGILTSVYFQSILLRAQCEFRGRRFALVQVLVKPVFPVVEGLGVHDVHESGEELQMLQQKVEVSKYQLGIPGGTNFEVSNSQNSHKSQDLLLSLPG